MALAAKQLNAKMIYISSDYVFDGQGDVPFEVDVPIAPQNVYGLTKAQGEAEVRKLLPSFSSYASAGYLKINGNNFIKTMLRLGAERETLSVVNDQIGSPTFTDDLAPPLCDMLVTEQYDTYHATNEAYCSRYELASFIMAQANLACQVQPITRRGHVKDFLHI